MPNAGSMRRFPRLRDKILEEAGRVIRCNLAPTQTMLSQIIAIEQSYINTSHPDFIGGSEAVAQLVKQQQPNIDDDARHDVIKKILPDEHSNSSISKRGLEDDKTRMSNGIGSDRKPPMSSSTPVVNHSATPSQQTASGWLGSIFGNYSSTRIDQTPTSRARLQTQTITGAYLPGMTDRERMETEIISKLNLLLYFACRIACNLLFQCCS